jgi:hypothetical protein
MAVMHGHHDDQSRQEHPLSYKESYKESHNEEAYHPYKTVRMIRHVMRRNFL